MKMNHHLKNMKESHFFSYLKRVSYKTHLLHVIFLIHVILTIFIIFSAASDASTILERRYIFDKLDDLWKGTIAQEAPQESWFTELVAEGSGYQAVLEDPPLRSGEDSSTFDDLPFEGVLLGEDASARSGDRSRQVRGFPVIALPKGLGSNLYKRLAQLEIYLNRNMDFAPTSTDTAEELDALRRRMQSATLETYLLHLLLYFSENTFDKKCSRLQRVKELEVQGLQGWEEKDLLTPWKNLWVIYQNAKSKFSQDIMRALACKVKPTRTRGEVEKIIKEKAESLIHYEVKNKIEETFVLLQEASSKFQQLVTMMDIEMKTKEIMELERVLGNVQANLLIVKHDQLKAGDLIEKLRRVDLSQLNTAGGLQELKESNALTENLALKIATFLKDLSAIAQVSRDAQITESLKDCKGLEAFYQNLDMSSDTATLRNRLMPRFEGCLISVQGLIEKNKKPSASKKLMGKMSQHMQQISHGILGDQGGTP